MAESFLSLRVSKTGGQTWSDWKARSLGDTGDFIRPCIWRRLGVGRHFTFDFRADGAPDILAGSLLDAAGMWVDGDVIGPAYADENRPWSSQDTVNYIPVVAEVAGARSGRKLRGTPGYRLFANVGDGPIRAVRDVEGKLFVVSGTGLYLVTRDTTTDVTNQHAHAAGHTLARHFDLPDCYAELQGRKLSLVEPWNAADGMK